MESNPVGLYITFWAQPGKIDALTEAVTAMIPTAADETGTLVYGMHHIDGPRQGVSVYEIYKDAAAQAVHGASSALAELRGKLGELIDGAPERHALRPISNGKGLPF